MSLPNLHSGSNSLGSNNRCHKCFTQGKLVKNITVQHLVMSEYRDSVGQLDYYLCMNPECEVVYYNPKTLSIFQKNQINVPIWCKSDVDPKYACYCSKVTEQDVIDAVVNQGASTMKEVLKITGAMSHSQCQKMNPLGICCHQIVLEAIDKGLRMKKSKE